MVDQQPDVVDLHSAGTQFVPRADEVGGRHPMPLENLAEVRMARQLVGDELFSIGGGAA
jgi:hypothetical protein